MQELLPSLGPWTTHPYAAEWSQSQPIEIPLFDNQAVPFVVPIEDDWGKDFYQKNKTEIEGLIPKAIEAFLKLDTKYREKISEVVYGNYKQTMEIMSDDEMVKIDSAPEVWSHIHPKEIYIKYRDRVHANADPANNKQIYVQVCCDCDWEAEHGLVLLFKGGDKLVRVSEYDGHLTEAEAMGMPDSEDVLLSNPI